MTAHCLQWRPAAARPGSTSSAWARAASHRRCRRPRSRPHTAQPIFCEPQVPRSFREFLASPACPAAGLQAAVVTRADRAQPNRALSSARSFRPAPKDRQRTRPRPDQVGPPWAGGLAPVPGEACSCSNPGAGHSARPCGCSPGKARSAVVRQGVRGAPSSAVLRRTDLRIQKMLSDVLDRQRIHHRRSATQHSACVAPLLTFPLGRTTTSHHRAGILRRPLRSCADIRLPPSAHWSPLGGPWFVPP